MGTLRAERDRLWIAGRSPLPVAHGKMVAGSWVDGGGWILDNHGLSPMISI